MNGVLAWYPESFHNNVFFPHGSAYLMAIAVAPTAQKQGNAQALLGHMFSRATRRTVAVEARVRFLNTASRRALARAAAADNRHYMEQVPEARSVAGGGNDPQGPLLWVLLTTDAGLQELAARRQHQVHPIPLQLA